MASSPAVRSTAPASVTWTPELVVAELEQAFRTLRALPSGGFSQATRVSGLGAALELLGGNSGASWPAEPCLMKPPIPSAAKISRMDVVLRWLSLIPDDRYALRKVIAARAQTSFATCRPMAWVAVGRQIGADPAAAKTWHATAIMLIVRRLNAAHVPPPPEPGR